MDDGEGGEWEISRSKEVGATSSLGQVDPKKRTASHPSRSPARSWCGGGRSVHTRARGDRPRSPPPCGCGVRNIQEASAIGGEHLSSMTSPRDHGEGQGSHTSSSRKPAGHLYTIDHLYTAPLHTHTPPTHLTPLAALTAAAVLPSFSAASAWLLACPGSRRCTVYRWRPLGCQLSGASRPSECSAVE
jgi:hypothetical protein